MPRLPGSSPGQSPPVNPDSWLITLQRNPSDSGRRWWIKLLASQPVLPDTSSRNSGLEGRTYSRNLCRKAGIHHCLRILRRKECLKKDISKNEKKGRLSLFLVWRGAFFVKVWLVCSRQVKKTKFMRDKVKHSSWTGKGGGEGERERETFTWNENKCVFLLLTLNFLLLFTLKTLLHQHAENRKHETPEEIWKQWKCFRFSLKKVVSKDKRAFRT